MKIQISNRIGRIVAVAAIAMLIGGCSSAAAPVLSDVGNGATGERLPAMAGTAGPAAPDAFGPMPSAAPSAAAAAGTTGGTGQSASFADGAKIIMTGSLSLEVAKLDDALTRARSTIVGLGGYVSGSNEANSGEKTAAQIVYRIPVDRWNDALDALRALSTKVVAEQTNAVDVTGQVLDLDARIKNLKVTETALQAIMVRATKISDILAVQQQLTDVRGQIEELSTEQAHLADQTAMGTLSVDFSVPIPAVTVTSQGWDPGAEVDRASASLVGLLQGLAGAGIWFGIVGLPVLVGAFILLGILVLVARRLGLGRGRGGMLPPTATPAAPLAPDA